MQRKILWKQIITFALAMKRIFARTYTQKDSRSFLKETLVTLALCINYACAFVSVLFLKLESLYFIVLVFVLSFLPGLLSPSLGKSILKVLLSIVAGAAITVALYLAPLWVYNQTNMINMVLDQVLTFLAPYLIFGTLFAFLGSMLTSLMRDFFR